MSNTIVTTIKVKGATDMTKTVTLAPRELGMTEDLVTGEVKLYLGVEGSLTPVLLATANYTP
jgi:hypothetical protein